MRLEIIIPDNTRTSLKTKIADIAQLLSKSPELVEQIHLNGHEDGEDAAIQKLFTPERLATIDAAKADMDAGNLLTMEELDGELQANRAAWLAAHPQ